MSRAEVARDDRPKFTTSAAVDRQPRWVAVPARLLGQLMGHTAGVGRVLLGREAAIVGHRPVPVSAIRMSEPASLARAVTVSPRGSDRREG